MNAALVQEYRAGLARGELLVQSCGECGRLNMYPRYACPFCQSEALDWRKATGTGVLHSYTVVRAVPPKGFEQDIPYALGVVKLEEGVQLLARLWPSDGEGDWGAYACDIAVELTPPPGDVVERPIAWFRLPSS